MESKNKNLKLKRQSKILELIDKEPLQTQEEVLERLRESGFQSTQATVSRDIKELSLKKLLTSDGEYRYAPENTELDGGLMARVEQVFKASVTKIQGAQNIVVVKTLPGMAQAAAYAIDSLKLKNVVGSIAGDDTLFIVAPDTAQADVLCEDLNKLLY